MTSLLSGSTSTSDRPAADVRAGHGHRRPVVLVAALGGVAAAASTLLVCLAVGVVGWFLTDAGAHGTPRDGLRVGALGWLLAHGSGIVIDSVAVSAVPLGLTALAAWTIWRVGHRVGESVCGHGPDADRIADGERDWTVPLASAVLALGYLVVAVVTAMLAATPSASPGTGRVLGWSLLLCLAAGVPAIAVGSGRAAIWAAFLPASLRAAALTCRAVVKGFALVSAVTFLAALALDLGTAANVMSQLPADAGDAALFTLLTTAVVPNAVVFAGSYLLGPGFTVGIGTLVSPIAVTIGPLPMFPLLAALPDNGPTGAWTPYLMGVPLLVAAVAAARAQRRLPVVRWEENALRACAGGVLAGMVVGVLAGLAGGAVGPGRMRDVGPLVSEVLVHAITAFGIGGLLGALVMTWWQRRAGARDDAPKADARTPDARIADAPGTNASTVS